MYAKQSQIGQERHLGVCAITKQAIHRVNVAKAEGVKTAMENVSNVLPRVVQIASVSGIMNLKMELANVNIVQMAGLQMVTQGVLHVNDAIQKAGL